MENLGFDGRTILKWIFKKNGEVLEWIDFVRERDK